MDKTITPIQCRGARAILNLTRDQLSELSGVGLGTIGNFETGGSETRMQARNILRLTLENAGVQFIDSDGVRLRQDNIRTYEGEKAHRQLLDEIYHDLKETGGEVLIKGLDESRWGSGDDEAFLKHHIDRLIAADVTERLLVSEAHNFPVVHKHWYRQIPVEYFSPATQWMFAGKIGMVTWGDVEKLIIIESKPLYDAETRAFNCIWDNVGKVLD